MTTTSEMSEPARPYLEAFPRPRNTTHTHTHDGHNPPAYTWPAQPTQQGPSRARPGAETPKTAPCSCNTSAWRRRWGRGRGAFTAIVTATAAVMVAQAGRPRGARARVPPALRLPSSRRAWLRTCPTGAARPWWAGSAGGRRGHSTAAAPQPPRRNWALRARACMGRRGCGGGGGTWGPRGRRRCAWWAR